MANISNELSKIRAANWGGDLRSSIADALEKVNNNEGGGGEGGSSLQNIIDAENGGIIEGDIENNQATGTNAHAEGFYTTASGSYSHAEGAGNMARGEGSHTEGSGTIADGGYSHVEGIGTISRFLAQHVFGTFNRGDDYIGSALDKGFYVEIVGNGSDDHNKSNARTLDWEGNERLAGTLTIGDGTADQVTITPAQLKALLALLN